MKALRNRRTSQAPCSAHDDAVMGLMQDMGQEFARGADIYTLTAAEIEVCYLALVRLKDLEEAGHARDWLTIRAYCPRR